MTQQHKFDVFDTICRWARTEGVKVWAQASVDSTNLEAKRQAFRAPDEILLFVADQQSAGRGRGVNKWLSPPPGTALLATWALRLATPAQPIAAPLLGLALYDASITTWPSSPWSLKAPNDLLLGGKKVGGLLAEGISQGDNHILLIGLGLNVLAKPPGVPDSRSLTEEIEVTEVAFRDFLDVWSRQLGEVGELCQRPQLPAERLDRLTAALNRNPNLTEPLKSVTPDGDLIFPSSRRAWKDL
jgi:BirA family biotin operon repressor/biotin-[acetyl-CoA-carboxylase] ligase